MEYEVRYDSYYRNDSWDWKKRIRVKNDEKARNKADQLIDALNGEAKKRRTGRSYKLTGIFRVSKKRICVTEEKFTPIFETNQF